MNNLPRRHAFAGLLAGASVSSSRVFSKAEDASESPAAGASTVTATEVLMREHGVSSRLMLVYEALLALPASSFEGLHAVLHGTASLIRSFIEDYHGMLEERFVFPLLDRQRTHTNPEGARRSP